MNQLEEELGQANVILGLATYSQAMKSEDVDKWIDAMHEEKSSWNRRAFGRFMILLTY